MLPFIAQTATDPAATANLLQYGAIGAVLVIALYALRVLFVRITANADAERQRADRLEAELRETNRLIQDKHLSALSEATHVMGQVIDVMREDRQR